MIQIFNNLRRWLSADLNRKLAIMAIEITTLIQATAALTSAVDKLASAPAPINPADVQAAADAVNAQTARIVALTPAAQ